MNVKNIIKTGLAIYGGTALAVDIIVVPMAKRIMVKHGLDPMSYVNYANTKRPRRTTTRRYIIHKGGGDE